MEKRKNFWDLSMFTDTKELSMSPVKPLRETFDMINEGIGLP